MARNTNNGTRIGAVKNRSQIYNPSTGNYIKRDTETGKFIDVKTDGKPFKGIRKEENIIKSNPAINPVTAKLAEDAVIKVRNSMKKVDK
jgi:hypothetical protein